MKFRSYAHNLEDILLWRALGHVVNGFYLDIGSQHPVRCSVSRGFYEQGWRGWHFEPQPAFADMIRRNRPDEQVHQVALSDEEGVLRLYVPEDSALTTGRAEYAAAARLAGGRVTEIDVPVTTLSKVCEGLSNRDVHWMKIDVEGMEEQVLRGWDGAVLRPWVIVLEATLPHSSERTQSAWEGLLTGAGYEFAHFDGVNSYFLASEHRELRSAFAAPVNIRDLSKGGCELDLSSAFRKNSRSLPVILWHDMMQAGARILVSLGLRAG